MVTDGRSVDEGDQDHHYTVIIDISEEENK